MWFCFRHFYWLYAYNAYDAYACFVKRLCRSGDITLPLEKCWLLFPSAVGFKSLIASRADSNYVALQGLVDGIHQLLKANWVCVVCRW